MSSLFLRMTINFNHLKYMLFRKALADSIFVDYSTVSKLLLEHASQCLLPQLLIDPYLIISSS